MKEILERFEKSMQTGGDLTFMDFIDALHSKAKEEKIYSDEEIAEMRESMVELYNSPIEEKEALANLLKYEYELEDEEKDL